MPTLLYKRLNEYAKVPTRAEDGSAGYDLYYNGEPFTLPAGSRYLLPTGIALAIPRDRYGRIAPRSGLAFNYGIDVLAGVIDWSYRGEIKVLLLNTGDKDFDIKYGDRIAQLIIEKISTPELVEVQELPSSVRGAGGFGSTG